MEHCLGKNLEICGGKHLERVNHSRCQCPLQEELRYTILGMGKYPSCSKAQGVGSI